jgi:hypothetical protein
LKTSCARLVISLMYANHLHLFTKYSILAL